MEWIDSARKTGLVKRMSRGEQNEYLDTLYQASKSEGLLGDNVRERAGEMYSQMKKQCIKM